MDRLTVRWRESLFATRTLILVFLAIGVGLTLQPARFSNTPSYANLLAFAPSEVWGGAYLLTAAALVAWRLAPATLIERNTNAVSQVRPTTEVMQSGTLTLWLVKPRWLGITAHTLAAILTGWWLAAFFIRYSSNDGTTIVNVVSWAVYFALFVQSTRGIDGEPRG